MGGRKKFVLKNGKIKFKSSLRKHPHTHTFYPVDEFFYVNMIYYTVLSKCCSILHCKFVYMSIHVLFHILLSL
jgi:hypothetical protein